MLTNFGTPASLFGAIFAALACILLLRIHRKIGRRSGNSDEKITSFFESMRDEFARNRKETGEQGQAQREERGDLFVRIPASSPYFTMYKEKENTS